MNGFGELLVGVVMAIGLVGTLVPVVPGVILTWLAGLTWAVADGGGAVRWSLFGVMTLLLSTALVAGVRIPVRRVSDNPAPRGTLLLASVLAVFGFFVIPVIGVLVGFSAGILLAHLVATNDIHQSFDAMWATLRSFGKAAVVQGACGLLICLTWILGLILT